MKNKQQPHFAKSTQSSHIVEEHRYLGTTQVARRWAVSSVTIHRLIEQGDLSGLKIGGSYRISRRSIEEYEAKVAF